MYTLPPSIMAPPSKPTTDGDVPIWPTESVFFYLRPSLLLLCESFFYFFAKTIFLRSHHNDVPAKVIIIISSYTHTKKENRCDGVRFNVYVRVQRIQCVITAATAFGFYGFYVSNNILAFPIAFYLCTYFFFYDFSRGKRFSRISSCVV